VELPLIQHAECKQRRIGLELRLRERPVAQRTSPSLGGPQLVLGMEEHEEEAQ
jgi:hypothetical protein